MRIFRLSFAAALLPFAAFASDPITINADLREASRGLIHATVSIPVHPGPLTLLYPRWIPGEHSPSGPVVNVGGLKLTAGGRTLEWRRDLENMFAIHLQVPDGVTRVEAKLDYLAPVDANSGYSAGPTTSSQLAMLNWNLIALYPEGFSASDVQVAASMTLPNGWNFGTSLQIASSDDRQISFKPVSLEMLIDQPVIAGAHFKRFALTPGSSPEHFIDCAADSEAALGISEEHLLDYRKVPGEYAAVMGIRHYQTYHFLLALSDRTGYNGVEHHQCSDDRSPERSLIDDDVFRGFASLLTHEYFHSWNGKYRRPADLLSPDYQKPMKTDLLWVYEGLTEYYGDVMAARAGLLTPHEYTEYIALVAAGLANQKGREWRPLQDTADEAQLLYYADAAWTARRRAVDFYDEGELIWLEADVLIRTKTKGARNLDDFARLFFGDGQNGPIDPANTPGETPSVKPYSVEDVYAALGKILPYDWKGFFTERLTSTKPVPPMGGITGGGWRLAFNDSTNPMVASDEKTLKRTNLKYSLGFSYDADSQTISDVIPGSPADKAGVGPSMKVIGINGRKYSDDGMTDAITAGKSGAPIDLLLENADYLTTFRLTYSGGVRYPHLEKEAGQADVLSAIIKSRVP